MRDVSINGLKANARRIVACVNACAGISTEALEAGAIKDLLAACKAISEYLRVEGSIVVDGCWHGVLDAAIAKAEGD